METAGSVSRVTADTLILYGISRKMSVMEINEHLLNLNFELLE